MLAWHKAAPRKAGSKPRAKPKPAHPIKPVKNVSPPLLQSAKYRPPFLPAKPLQPCRQLVVEEDMTLRAHEMVPFWNSTAAEISAGWWLPTSENMLDVGRFSGDPFMESLSVKINRNAAPDDRTTFAFRAPPAKRRIYPKKPEELADHVKLSRFFYNRVSRYVDARIAEREPPKTRRDSNAPRATNICDALVARATRPVTPLSTSETCMQGAQERVLDILQMAVEELVDEGTKNRLVPYKTPGPDVRYRVHGALIGDCRAHVDVSRSGDRWYVYDKFAPQNKSRCNDAMFDNAFIDLGVRTFATVYSPEGVVMKIGDEFIRRLMTGRSRDVRADVGAFHDRAVELLCATFMNMFVPRLTPQHGRTEMSLLDHDAFVTKLMARAKTGGRNVYLISEPYTTKTCTCCGVVNNRIGAAKVHACGSCDLVMDRDNQGARNNGLAIVTRLVDKQLKPKAC